MSSPKTLVSSLLLASLAHSVFGQIPGNTGSKIVPSYLSGFYAPYTSVGIVRTRFGRFSSRGSAAVARDSRLLYSCAHLVYDYQYGWSPTFAFSRGHNSLKAPNPKSYVVARGYRVRAGYAPDGENFDFDFAVAYGGAATSFGPPLPIDDNPIGSITSSSVEKRIVGYPADLDDVFYANTGGFFMYETGPFTTKVYADYDTFTPGGEYTADWTTTGAGNSGGPLVVYDGRWKLSAILVSGSNYYDWYYYDDTPFSGVHVLDDACEALADDALGFATSGGRTERINWTSGPITDGNRRYASRSFNFSVPEAPDLQGPAFGVAAQLTQVSVDLDITAGRRGDIDAYIRSPRGRIAILATASTDPAVANEPNLSLDDHTVGSSDPLFLSSSPGGTWSLFFRDSVPGNSSWFNSAALTLHTRWPL
jgi:hypothetical protein